MWQTHRDRIHPAAWRRRIFETFLGPRETRPVGLFPATSPRRLLLLRLFRFFFSFFSFLSTHLLRGGIILLLSDDVDVNDGRCNFFLLFFSFDQWENTETFVSISLDVIVRRGKASIFGVGKVMKILYKEEGQEGYAEMIERRGLEGLDKDKKGWRMNGNKRKTMRNRFSNRCTFLQRWKNLF